VEATLAVLLGSAVTIGVIHTAIGPDHYLPFIVLGRAEGWTLRKTLIITGLCGLGHVLGSVALGALGVALGWAVAGMERLEGVRGDVASLVLIGFGALYFVWGLWRGRRGHVHTHIHQDGSVHRHAHHHEGPADDLDHGRTAHEEQRHVRSHRRTLWALFIIFVLGPCEPLIPLLLVPASQHSAAGVAAVAAVFGAATVSTMLLIVGLGSVGVGLVRLRALEPYVHALAGFAILGSGAVIRLFGL
jgi:ABC-type nickel/cobalt efflux system permease component RcnA